MKKLVLFSCLFYTLISFAQDPGGITPKLQQMIQQNISNGEVQVFTPLASKSVMGFALAQTAGLPQPYVESLTAKGAVVLALRHDPLRDICPEGDRSGYLEAWVMFLDPDNTYDYFSVNPRNKIASLRISGRMDKYIPGPGWCDSAEMQKVDSGEGNLWVNFRTYSHPKPRTFQVMGQGGKPTGRTKQMYEARELLHKNLIAYYKYISEFQGEPRISRIGGNQQWDDLEIGGKVPAGTEEADDDGWKAIADGLVSLKNAAQAFSLAKDFKGFMTKAAQRFGPAKKFPKEMKIEALNMATSVAQFSGIETPNMDFLDANKVAEGEINRVIGMMTQSFQQVANMYAERKNDQVAKESIKKTTKRFKNGKEIQKGTDADFMLYQLTSIFEELETLESQMDLDDPTTMVDGRIVGPGIYKNLTALTVEGSPITHVANSTALSENQEFNDPAFMDQLKEMGIELPEGMENIDVNAMLEQAMAQTGGKVDFDLKAPLFNGIVSTAERITLQDGTRFNPWQIVFAVSSPDEMDEDHWLLINTIFDQPADNDNNTKPEEKTFYVATTGSDTNPGTDEAPFATMTRALEESLFHRQGMKPVTIIVKDGTYKQVAEVNWAINAGLAPLTIRAENKHKAVFIGTEPVSPNVSWLQNKANGYFIANTPLHPQQLTYSPGGNPMENPAPVITVNGSKLTHIPGNLPPGLSMMYSFGGSKVTVAPPEGVSNLSEANVEVSVRAHALKFQGGGDITISGLRLVNYPHNLAQNTPGISHDGNVKALGCKFE